MQLSFVVHTYLLSFVSVKALEFFTEKRFLQNKVKEVTVKKGAPNHFHSGVGTWKP